MKKRTIFLTLLLFSLFMNGCKYDFIMPVEVPPITGTVSFSTQVVPIFTAGTNCTSCHKTGGQAPDLTTANAFASIVPSMVNTATPGQSMIYTIPAPATSGHTWKKYTAGEAAIILAWITAGAKNN
ncbi:MAG: hypothetical protein GZ094_13325 [Mariniphaga sp.]|nr:hypothetical protein [Mariniphaga sp.]